MPQNDSIVGVSYIEKLTRIRGAWEYLHAKELSKPALARMLGVSVFNYGNYRNILNCGGTPKMKFIESIDRVMGELEAQLKERLN